MGDPPAERIRAALAALAVGSLPPAPGRRVALGWATVESDRAVRELGGALGLAVDAFAPADDSAALGARCRVALDALELGLALVILEPSTESRLAAILARRGEGPAVTWSIADDEGSDPAGTTPTPGPFGPEWLARGGSDDGLRRFLIRPETGTIDR